jgi:hypothetical protein
MGYKILGFAVWQVGKWYVRRRLPGAPPKPVIAATAVAAGGLMIAGGLAVANRRTSD